MTTFTRVSSDGLPSGSASSIVAGAVCGYHVLKIDGYSRTKELPSGKWIDSCPFRVRGRTWHVRYFPNGDESKSSDYISLFLALHPLAGAETVKAQVKFSLLDQDGKLVPSYTHTTKIKDFSVEISWGFNKFIRRDALEGSEHLKDDSFTVKADVTIMREFHTQETPSIAVPPSDLQRHLGDLFTSKAGADVEFRVGEETLVSAHRSVLAARSPVFRAQFFGSMKEGTTTEAISIDDVEAGVFSALLTFMYTDALPDMDKQEESAMAQHLLVAADKYGLDRLKLICEDKLCSRIDTSSVATILALAEQHHCRGLKAACLLFLRSPGNLDEAMESEGFEFLTTSCPGVLKDLLRSQVVPSLLGKRKPA